MGRPPKKYHFSTTHHYDDFEIGVSDWESIERHSDYEISESARSQIIAHIKYFLPMAEAERNAPPLYPPSSPSKKGPKQSAAKARLGKIQLHATKLCDVLNEIEDYSSENPALSADDLIGMNCDRPELGGKSVPPKAKFCTLRLPNILKDFVAACNAATQELKILEGKGKLPKGFKPSEPFKDGDAWNEWVVALAQIIAKQGLQVSASMYHGTSRKSNLSNFVRLIRALHKIIPLELVPRHSTDEALAKAAQRALRRKP